MARFATRLGLLLLVSLIAGLTGCKGGAVPGLTTPDFALSTPAPLPAPGEAYPAGAGRAPPGVPVIPNETYTLDSGDSVRIIVFGQQNLCRNRPCGGHREQQRPEPAEPRRAM